MLVAIMTAAEPAVVLKAGMKEENSLLTEKVPGRISG